MSPVDPISRPSGYAPVVRTFFSDPMMGLAHEAQAVLRKIETHFAGQVEIRNAMAPLVRETNIDERAFLEAFEGPAAARALGADRRLAEDLGVYGLPACLVSCGSRALMLNGMAGYTTFVQAIDQVSKGLAIPRRVEATPKALCGLLDRHPIISATEICGALDLPNDRTARELVEELLRGRKSSDGANKTGGDIDDVRVVDVRSSWFCIRSGER